MCMSSSRWSVGERCLRLGLGLEGRDGIDGKRGKGDLWRRRRRAGSAAAGSSARICEWWRDMCGVGNKRGNRSDCGTPMIHEHVEPARQTRRTSTGTATGIHAGRGEDEDMSIVRGRTAHCTAGVHGVQIHWEGARLNHTPRAARAAIRAEPIRG